MSKSPSPRSPPPPAFAMADRTATAAADGGSGGGDGGGGKEAPDALTDNGAAAAVPKMSPEPAGSPGQRRRQAAPAAGSAEPDAAAVQGSNMDKCELAKYHKPKGISSRDNNFCNRIDLLR